MNNSFATFIHFDETIWVGYLANTFNSLKFYILSEYLYRYIYDALIKLSMNRCLGPYPYPISLPNPKIQPTGILTLKSRNPFRNVPENGSAVPVSIDQPDLPALKINAELPFKRLLPQLPLII